MNTICARAACATVSWSVQSGSNPPARVGSRRAFAKLSTKLKKKSLDRGLGCVTRASDGGSPESTTMDYQGALKFLGLSENASSEDMVKAKNQMTPRCGDQDE